MKESKSLNRKMVEAALILKQINGEVYQNVPHDVNLKHVYCASFTNNVVNGVTADMFCSDLIHGDGGELSNPSGMAPKFNSITSSAALAVSTFAPWKARIRQLEIDLGSCLLSGFNTMTFEHIATTAIPHALKHPNLDVWLESDDTVLAIECKFCEYNGGGSSNHTLHNAYKRLADELELDSPWVKAMDHLRNSKGVGNYRFFDATQMLRHYFGVANSGKAEKHLLYLYWHPENDDWRQIRPFSTHEKELKDFADRVAGSGDVHFHSLSFNQLWENWSLTNNPDVQEHVKLLKKKYSVIIN